KVICNGSIANIYIQKGKAKEALAIINKNFPLVEKLKNKKYLAFEYLNLGWAQTKLKQYQKAEKNLLTGLTSAKNNDFISSISAEYSYLYELKKETTYYKDALKYYKLAEEFDNKISNERNTHYVNNLIIKYDSERKNNQIKDLAKQNKITQLQLLKNRNLWIISIILLTLLGVILYSLYKHQLLKNDKKIVTLQQEALRAQMNPHFIFNALNSIKLYIINNEQKNAVKFLNKFSKLMRKILEVSSVKEISLAQELETMDLYMSIENIRFSNEIDFQINVSPDLNLEQIKVPSLVLQPFLENALWHGLSSKKENKKIQLSVQKSEDDYIEISIEDNGIGREAAAKIKANKTIKRKSIGIELTKERLQNFVKDRKKSFSLIYKDLKDKELQGIGTKVILKIPLK
ncbi:MAG TPA: sensor histidine kinase, partial [Saprospiraceae bacterium]|nr:sensor histidine kinase [Saprospiraceae bacterium]